MSGSNTRVRILPSAGVPTESVDVHRGGLLTALTGHRATVDPDAALAPSLATTPTVRR